jgi:uncharacterized membrane protein YuzA (DUF378 family)
MVKKINMTDRVAMWLSAVGGLNWGLVGIGNFMGSNWNLVNWIFGGYPVIENFVYVVVGVSAGYLVFKSIK